MSQMRCVAGLVIASLCVLLLGTTQAQETKTCGWDGTFCNLEVGHMWDVVDDDQKWLPKTHREVISHFAYNCLVLRTQSSCVGNTYSHCEWSPKDKTCYVANEYAVYMGLMNYRCPTQPVSQFTQCIVDPSCSTAGCVQFNKQVYNISTYTCVPDWFLDKTEDEKLVFLAQYRAPASVLWKQCIPSWIPLLTSMLCNYDTQAACWGSGICRIDMNDRCVPKDLLMVAIFYRNWQQAAQLIQKQQLCRTLPDVDTCNAKNTDPVLTPFVNPFTDNPFMDVLKRVTNKTETVLINDFAVTKTGGPPTSDSRYNAGSYAMPNSSALSSGAGDYMSRNAAAPLGQTLAARLLQVTLMAVALSCILLL